MANLVSLQAQLPLAYSKYPPTLYTAQVQLGVAGVSDIGFITVFTGFEKASKLYGIWVDVVQVNGAGATDMSNFAVWVSTGASSDKFQLFHRRPHDTITTQFYEPPSKWVSPWPGWGVELTKNGVISVENITGSIAAILIVKALIGQ